MPGIGLRCHLMDDNTGLHGLYGTELAPCWIDDLGWTAADPYVFRPTDWRPAVQPPDLEPVHRHRRTVPPSVAGGYTLTAEAVTVWTCHGWRVWLAVTWRTIHDTAAVHDSTTLAGPWWAAYGDARTCAVTAADAITGDETLMDQTLAGAPLAGSLDTRRVDRWITAITDVERWAEGINGKPPGPADAINAWHVIGGCTPGDNDEDDDEDGTGRDDDLEGIEDIYGYPDGIADDIDYSPTGDDPRTCQMGRRWLHPVEDPPPDDEDDGKKHPAGPMISALLAGTTCG